MNKNKETNAKPVHKVRNDIILIVSLLLVAAIALIYLFCFRSEGNAVKITIDGKTYATFSLDKDITEDIYTGENSERLNRLIIKDGKAYMSTATCPDGICVDHAPIYRDGESIVCLPHGVVITVITQDTSNAPDVVI